MAKKILQIDLDGVAADFDGDFDKLPKVERWIEGQEKEVPKGFFTNLPPIEGAIESIRKLAEMYDVYFLSTPQWSNPDCWKEKRLWVEKHFGDLMHKRLTLTHHKGLVKGDYLIDDRIANGVENFEGEHIHFGTPEFPNWKVITDYLTQAYNLDNDITDYEDYISHLASI